MDPLPRPTPTVCRVLPPEWLHVPALPVGPVPPGAGSPRCYVCLERAGQRLRVDAHVRESEELCFRDDAVLVEDTLFVGAGHRVAVVDLCSRAVRDLELDAYFVDFHPLPDGVLAATGSSLYRIDRSGAIRWWARNLAVDGVRVQEVRDGEVRGEAEMDPPGGWRPFALALDTGRITTTGP